MKTLQTRHTRHRKELKMIYDFKNPEHFKILERQAYEGTINVDDFPPAAYRYFDRLRKLYYAFRFEGLPRESAERQKRMLLAQYHEASDAYEYYRRSCATYQDNIRKAGTLLSDIEKSKDVTEIALKACECIQYMTGECNFLKRQEKKIREGAENENNDHVQQLWQV